MDQGNCFKTVGLTGTKRDLPLLRKYFLQFGDPQRFGYNSMIRASMARLGDKESLKSISDGLKEPVARVKIDPSIEHEGVFRAKALPAAGANVVKSPPVEVSESGSGEKLREWMEAASFTMDRRFIPLLLSHLDDPRGQFHGDYSDPSPSSFACDALAKIALGHQGDGFAWKPADWKEWAAKHPKEAAGK